MLRQVLCGLLLMSSHLWSCAVLAQPWQPTDPNQVVLSLPRYAQTYRVTPPPTTPFEQVAPQISQALQDAYVYGDPRLIGQAQALLMPYQQSTQTDILLLRAQAAQADHAFDHAKQLFQQVLAQAPQQTQAQLSLAALAVVQGQFASARQHCRDMQDLSVLVLKMICEAQIDAVAGQSSKAKQTLLTLSSLRHTLSNDQALWLDLIQADLAIRTQDTALAQRVFAHATTSVPLLILHADWLLHRGQFAEALKLLTDAPAQDGVLIRLARAQLLLAHPDATQTLARLAKHQQQLLLRQDVGHAREIAHMALLLRQPQQALQWAKINWQHQRETIDVVIYTTAALRTSSITDLHILQAWLHQTGFVYPLIQQRIDQALRVAS